MPIGPTLGVPGVGAAYTATPKTILNNLLGAEYLEGGRIVDGVNSGDWSNPSFPNVITSGTMLGKISATGKYAPSILGVTQASLTTSATTLTVTSAQATEIARRLGASGTFTLVGPPTSGGTVASATVAYSAVNTSTGAITITETGVAFVVGSLVMPTDGSQSPRAVLESQWGLWVSDYFNTTRQDTNAPRLLVAGHLITSAIPALTSGDASTQAWLKSQLNSSGRHFIFDDDY